MPKIKTTDEHAEFKAKFMTLFAECKELSNEEQLAVASQIIGSMVACQDQTKYSIETVMNMVMKNIQEGNRATVETLNGLRGGMN